MFCLQSVGFCVIWRLVPSGPLNHFIAIAALQMLGLPHKFAGTGVSCFGAENIYFLNIYLIVHLIFGLA